MQLTIQILKQYPLGKTNLYSPLIQIQNTDNIASYEISGFGNSTEPLLLEEIWAINSWKGCVQILEVVISLPELELEKFRADSEFNVGDGSWSPRKIQAF